VAGGAVATAVSRNPDLPPLAVAFTMYLIPLRFPRRDALWLLAGALLVTAAPLAALASDPARPVGDVAGLLLGGGLLVTAAWAFGYSVRQQRAYTAGLAEQAERRAREQLAEARRAGSEERLQIARELHDVVAHTMSLIAVQAGVANYVISARPQEAARALSSIEQISRGALGEMRGLLVVLRAEGNDAGPRRQDGALVPAPGLADLGSLLERAAEAGVRVDLDVRGERPRLSAGLDLAAYRVIQEAITNVIKHAATDSCQLSVACQDDVLTLEITDSGSAGRSASGSNGSPAAGHGITGMRERVGMYGGQFRAAPLPGRGFQVTAVFPLAGTGA
jgi:signal transduction histidine kinase